MGHRVFLMRIGAVLTEYGDEEKARAAFDRRGKVIGKADIILMEKEGLIEDLEFDPDNYRDEELELAASVIEAILESRKGRKR